MFIALLLPLLAAAPHIVAGVESLFGHGKGETKKQAAMGILGDFGNALAAQNGFDGANSDLMQLLSEIIDSTVKYMNATGQFKHTDPVAVAIAGSGQ
jgi:hypothetical protein